MEEISKSTILQPLILNKDSKEGAEKSTEDVCVCIFCDHFEKNEIDNKKILQHLYFNHRLIISDVNEIKNVQEYLKYWKEQYKDHQIEEYCTTMLLKQLPDGTKTENDEKYYLLSDIVPRDKEIRMKIQNMMIEKALERHQFERSDNNFIRGCLYCRSSIDPTRYSYIEHLFSKHFLHVGKPENLVFIDELIDFIEDKLSNLICIYCEKTFKDRGTLKEHMRKKGHKKINPDNRTYDKFFMINYKIRDAPANSQQPRNFSFTPRNDVKEEKEIFDNNDDSEWSEWSEQDKEIQITCLFCSHTDINFNEILNHMTNAHKFDYEKVTENYNFYLKVKLINFIRRRIHLKVCLSCDEYFETQDNLLDHIKEKNHLICDRKNFDKAEFFFPTFEDDNFLCYLDSFNENDEMSDDSFGAVVSEDKLLVINEDAEMLSREKFLDL